MIVKPNKLIEQAISAYDWIEQQTRQIDREFKCSRPRPRNRANDKPKPKSTMKTIITILMLAVPALCQAQSLTLGWDYPETNEPDIQEFRLYQVHGGETNVVARPAPAARQVSVPVTTGDYTFWLTAANELESEPSNQLEHPGQPEPATNLRVIVEVNVTVE